MSRFTHPVSPKTSVLRPLAITAALLLQAACGGGGDSSPPAATTGTSAGTTASSTITARLSGVAALGAPMAGARLQVVDGTGTLVGSTTTNAADGSFALTLLPATGPLLLQAVGTDAAGQPLVLHGAVSTLSAAVVANVTPLSEAILAVALGAGAGLSPPPPQAASSSASVYAIGHRQVTWVEKGRMKLGMACSRAARCRSRQRDTTASRGPPVRHGRIKRRKAALFSRPGLGPRVTPVHEQVVQVSN